MNGIGYINLPKVPSEFLPPLEEIISMPSMYRGIEDKYNFSAKNISNEGLLRQWICDIFKVTNPLAVQYQIITGNLPAHRDRGRRKLAFSYILATGGENVTTHIHDDVDQSIIVQSEKIQLHRWHYLVTQRLHSVSGMEEGVTRVSISMSPHPLYSNHPLWWERWRKFIAENSI